MKKGVVAPTAGGRTQTLWVGRWLGGWRRRVCCGAREERRRTVEALPADVAEVVEHARDLVEHHTDHLRATRHLHVEQLLDGERVAVLGRHHGAIVEAVHVGEGLLVVLVLDELLGAAVQQPDVRVGADHRLAVELEHQPEHAVRRGVLRPKVDREVLDLRLLVDDELALHQRLLL